MERDPSREAALIERVRTRVARWLGRGVGPAWVVAVSGGGDSIGLLRALGEIGPGLGLRLSVAHLDHGVRGEAGEADARFVEQLAGTLGLPFDLGHWKPTRSGHFEADARRARYAWLLDVARARGASAVAVGHSRDDQAETILHRILRGTGPRGLAGMPARRPLGEGVQLLRPLLGVGRAEIRAYLAAIGQDYRDDPTNADRARTRARLRHDLLPKLADEYNPRVAEALVRLGTLAGALQRALDRRLDRLAGRATITIGADAVVLLGSRLAAIPMVLRAEVLRQVWRRRGWPEAGMGAGDWVRLAKLVRGGDGRLTVGGIDAWHSNGILRLSPAGSEPEAVRNAPVRLPLPGAAVWGECRVVTTLDPDAPRDEALDLDRLEPFRASSGALSLCIRGPRDGDRFEPLGMDGHGMPLNDFLRGRKVPRERRGEVLLVYDRRGIVWVVGHRIAHRVRLTEATRRPLGLRREPAGCD